MIPVDDAITVLTTKEALALFEGVESVAICAHINPDGDALGSSLALAAFLRARGCRAICLLAQDQPAPELYAFLEGYEFVNVDSYTETPDLFVAIDVPVPSRLGDATAVLERSPRSLCIDHHPDYSGFATWYYGDTLASATATLVWALIKESGEKITHNMAEYCYVGLMTDTGRFSFQNTSEQSFRDAADMVACGVNPTSMSMNVYETKSVDALRLESRLIDRVRFSHDKSIVYSWIDEQDLYDLGVTRDDTEGLPTVLRSILGAQVSVLLRVEGELVRANLRSRGSFDVGELARRFGGGGHQAAAGFTFKGSPDEVMDMLSEAIGDIENNRPDSRCRRPGLRRHRSGMRH